MASFVHLTDEEGFRLRINIDAILYYKPEYPTANNDAGQEKWKTVIYLTDGKKIVVLATPPDS